MKLEPIWEARTHQELFRKLLTAMARPGELIEARDLLAGSPAHLGVLATLVDGTVTLSDPHCLLDEDQRGLLAAPNRTPDKALFVLADGSVEPNFVPVLGNLSNPDKGATLIIAGHSIGTGNTTMSLSGPGIDGQRRLQSEGFHREWFIRREEWVADFPMGVDLILCGASRIAAIPRTTVVGGF